MMGIVVWMPTSSQRPGRSVEHRLVAGISLAGDVPDSGAARRPADRRELRRAASPDGDGGTQPGSRLGPASASARHGALSQLLRGRAAALRVGRRRLEASDRLEPGRRRDEFSRPWRRRWRPGASSSWHGRAKGARVACLAVAAFAVFPLTIRYGRAFQPDAAMLGAVVAGLGLLGSVSIRPALVLARGRLVAGRARLRAQDHRRRFCWSRSLLVIARARAALRRFSRPARRLLPALAVVCVGRSPARAGRRLASLGRQPVDLARAPRARRRSSKPETLKFVGWFSARPSVHAPGCRSGRLRTLESATDRRSISDRLWLVWGISALVAMAFLAEKLHHEYYWLLARAGRRGGGRRARWTGSPRTTGPARSPRRRRWSCSARCRSARPGGRPPNGTTSRRRRAPSRRRSRATPGSSRPRRCCSRPTAAAAGWSGRRPRRSRAAGEWGAEHEVDSPLDLLEYYRRQGARYFADLGSRDADPPRKGLHDAVRRRYKVIVDRPEVIIADLADSEMHWNAN